MSRFGDKWARLVLYSLSQSETCVLRFKELRRLKRLEQSNLVHREVYAEVPPRVEYSLTATGLSLMPPLKELIDWALLHFDDVVNRQIKR